MPTHQDGIENCEEVYYSKILWFQTKIVGTLPPKALFNPDKKNGEAGFPKEKIKGSLVGAVLLKPYDSDPV